VESSNINSFLDSLFQGNDSKMSFSKITFSWNRRAPDRQKKATTESGFHGVFHWCVLSSARTVAENVVLPQA